MGGIGDYSGSLVLEMPIAEAAFAAVQQTIEPGVTVVSLPQQRRRTCASRHVSRATNGIAAVAVATTRRPARILHDDPQSAWAAYVLGPVLVLLRETPARLDGGLRILIDSRVPEGKGVSSSAAVEVATMRAVAALVEIRTSRRGARATLPGRGESRRRCAVRHHGSDDFGARPREQLLALLCQPATVEGYVAIPEGIAFWGVDSGIRHAVSAARITRRSAPAHSWAIASSPNGGTEAKPASDAPGVIGGRRSAVARLPGQHHAGRISGAICRRSAREMSGRDFLARYGGTTDTSRASIRHGRTPSASRRSTRSAKTPASQRFRELLQGANHRRRPPRNGRADVRRPRQLLRLRLGSDGTDLLGRTGPRAGPASGLYGAKITGGGSGGTVAILGRADAGPAVDELAREYTDRTGRETYHFPRLVARRMWQPT